MPVGASKYFAVSNNTGFLILLCALAILRTCTYDAEHFKIRTGYCVRGLD